MTYLGKLVPMFALCIFAEFTWRRSSLSCILYIRSRFTSELFPSGVFCSVGTATGESEDVPLTV